MICALNGPVAPTTLSSTPEMAGPPPPPPPPPGVPNISSSPSMAPSRDALFGDIHKGIKLKKTVTVDKSKPLIELKSTPSIGTPPSNSSSSGQHITGGPPQLGNLFAGGMPKLKSVKDNRNDRISPSAPLVPPARGASTLPIPLIPKTRPHKANSSVPPAPKVAVTSLTAQPPRSPPSLPKASSPAVPSVPPPLPSQTAHLLASSSLKVPKLPPSRPKKLSNLRSSSTAYTTSKKSQKGFEQSSLSSLPSPSTHSPAVPPPFTSFTVPTQTPPPPPPSALPMGTPQPPKAAIPLPPSLTGSYSSKAPSVPPAPSVSQRLALILTPLSKAPPAPFLDQINSRRSNTGAVSDTKSAILTHSQPKSAPAPTPLPQSVPNPPPIPTNGASSSSQSSQTPPAPSKVPPPPQHIIAPQYVPPPQASSISEQAPPTPPSLVPSSSQSHPPLPGQQPPTAPTRSSTGSILRLSQRLHKAAPPPPPSALDSQQSAGSSLRRIAALEYTLKGGSASERLKIEDPRFKFSNSSSLPHPRRYENVAKLYPSGRGSSVPLEFSLYT